MVRKLVEAYKYLQRYNHSRSVSPVQYFTYVMGL